MSLFSFLRKGKQESSTGDGAFYSRAEEDSKAVRSRKRSASKQGEEPADPVLPEKKRARRRLIGAVALVLAAVIGLPMILDSEPKPVADDISIQIPSKDKPVAATPSRPEPTGSKVTASASLDPKEEVLDPPETSASPVKANVTPEEQKPAVLPPVAAVTKPKEETRLAVDKPKAQPQKPVTKEAAAPVAKAESKSESKPEPKVDVRAQEKANDAARAKALLEGKPDPKAADKKSGKFVIQVAALATQEKVNELQSKLKGAGIKSYTQKVATESGDRTRIRVGPFASKDEAEKVRAKIVKLGLNSTLVPA